MRKLLTIIATLIICNACSAETVFWLSNGNIHSTNTCSDGDNISQPTDPKKSGYRFIGWKKGTAADLMAINGTTSSSDKTTWSVTYPYGTTSGSCTCSSSSSLYHSGSGTSCWCIISSASGNADPVFYTNTYKFYGSVGTTASVCTDSCCSSCANQMKNYASFRTKFSKIQ